MPKDGLDVFLMVSCTDLIWQKAHIEFETIVIRLDMRRGTGVVRRSRPQPGQLSSWIHKSDPDGGRLPALRSSHSFSSRYSG